MINYHIKKNILAVIGLLPFLYTGFVMAQAADTSSSSDASKPHGSISNKEPSEVSKANWWSDKLSVYWDVQYTDWHSDSEARGHQTMMPLTLMYRAGRAEFGVRTAWIESVNSTPGREGKVRTMSDTALSAAYMQPLRRGWSVRYNLDYNVPTGKATLTGAEKNAIMDGNLVMQTRFGEGGNLTPGIVFTKVINANIALGFGVSHTVRGSYDPNGDVGNDRLNPGDENRIIFQAQYAAEKIMLFGGLVFSESKATQVNDQKYFIKGSRADFNTMGVFSLPHQQNITADFRYGTQRPDTYTNNVTGNFEKENTNINGSNYYLMLEYAKKWRGRHTFKVSGEAVKVSANKYDQFNDLYNAGRHKYAVSIGETCDLSRNVQLSFSVKYFRMKDVATPATLRDTTYVGRGYRIGLINSF